LVVVLAKLVACLAFGPNLWQNGRGRAIIFKLINF
jgi:hypothetical protein